MISRRTMLALPAVLLPAIAKAESSISFVTDWAFEGQHAPFLFAAQSGLFQQNGLSVKIDRGFGSGDTVTKVAAGTYDVGIADLGAVIAFNASQHANKVISIFQMYDLAPLSIMSLTDANIRQPKDLMGKTIAAPVTDSSRVMFTVLAAVNKIDPHGVSWIDVSPQLRDSLLVQKRADAVSAQVSEIITFRSMGIPDAGLSVMRYADFGVRLYGHAIITRPEFADSHADELRRFLRAVMQSWRATILDPAPTIAAMKQRDPLVNQAVELSRLALMLKESIATEGVIKSGFSEVDPARVAFTARTITESYGIPSIDAATLYRADYLPSAADRAYPISSSKP